MAAAQAQVETSKATIEAAQAGIAAAAAAVETAKVNLGFTKLTSPIDGIVGAATTQVGNLVGPAGNAITTVSTLDPVKANFTVSEQEYLRLTAVDSQLHKLALDLVLSDGSVYPHKGRFSFADRQVDPSTGSIQLTGLFPNPGNRLRPGQYAKSARHARRSIGRAACAAKIRHGYAGLVSRGCRRSQQHHPLHTGESRRPHRLEMDRRRRIEAR